jgi:hypothetical protein
MPTEERVAAMLKATHHKSDEIILPLWGGHQCCQRCAGGLAQQAKNLLRLGAPRPCGPAKPWSLGSHSFGSQEHYFQLRRSADFWDFSLWLPAITHNNGLRLFTWAVDVGLPWKKALRGNELRQAKDVQRLAALGDFDVGRDGRRHVAGAASA